MPSIFIISCFPVTESLNENFHENVSVFFLEIILKSLEKEKARKKFLLRKDWEENVMKWEKRNINGVSNNLSILLQSGKSGQQ